MQKCDLKLYSSVSNAISKEIDPNPMCLLASQIPLSLCGPDSKLTTKDGIVPFTALRPAKQDSSPLSLENQEKYSQWEENIRGGNEIISTYLAISNRVLAYIQRF
jgi:hypothetical protein